MLRLLVGICLVLAVAQPNIATAQPRPGVDRREAIKKKIRALRAYTLTQELSLDDKTTAKLFPVLARWDDVTEKLVVQRFEIARRLAVANQLKDGKAIDKLIDEAVANQKSFWDLEEKRFAEIRRVLTPAQSARLLVVLPAFERKIQNQLRRAIARRAGVNDAAEDEDDVEPAPPPPRRGPRR